MRHVFAAGILVILSTLTALADTPKRSYIGHGRLVVNDVFGDTLDRWRTGSVVASHVWGPDWTGELPTAAGEVLELRLMGEVIAPEWLSGPTAGDRPYVGAWSLGLHTHFQKQGWQISAGADMTLTGPQTGLSHVQGALHDLLSLPKASAPVLNGQVANGLHGSLVVETGRDFAVGPATLRPFSELRWGVEDLARIGFDLSIGPVGQGDMLVRDPVTGHRYRAVSASDNGFGFVFGADVAKVTNSLYLPTTTNTLTDARSRLRAGVSWQQDKWRGFYGLTLLGPEFVGQRTSQLVGAVRIKINF